VLPCAEGTAISSRSHTRTLLSLEVVTTVFDLWAATTDITSSELRGRGEVAAGRDESHEVAQGCLRVGRGAFAARPRDLHSLH
jgi:hypothetical protein